MKSTLKLMNLKKLIFLPLIALALMMSCQTEETDIVNPPQEEIITANSTTANLMSKTASNDGSTDNIIDFANCLEVVLPVTVTANGVTITIEAFDDYDDLEALLDAFVNDDDEVVITFPITVILNDYTEIVINSQEELEAQIESCNGENEDDDDIECIDFQYPIAFSIYNTDFQVIETVAIENDEALYNFLETLNGPVLASLNFPVTMILSDGNTLEVNSNEELDAAIEAAEDDCDEDDDYDWNDDDDDECTEESIELALKECLWYIDLFNNSSELEGFDLDFTENYDLFVYNSQTGNVEAQGSWSVALDGDYLYLNIDVAFEGVGGNWKVIECYNDELELIRNQDTMILQQDCTIDFTVQDIQDTILTGQWLVANYNDSGVDETSDYANWILEFNTNGTVIATNNTSISGTWSANVNNGQLKMILDFGMQIPFDEFNDDWDVFDINAAMDRVELRDVSGGDGTTDILVFEKI